MSKDLQEFLKKFQTGNSMAGWHLNRRNLTLYEIEKIIEELLIFVDTELETSVRVQLYEQIKDNF